MNRRDFFTVLIKELKNIEPSELQDVLQYYNEYFDEAGIENEQNVIEELGSPQKIAAAIRATSTIKYYEQENQTTKKSFNTLWITIGTIFAAPIALPLAIVFSTLILAVVIVYASLLFSLFAVAVSLILAGAISFGTSFFVMAAHFPTFLFLMGSGVALIGLGLLFFIGCTTVAQASFKGLMLLINNIILRRSKANV